MKVLAGKKVLNYFLFSIPGQMSWIVRTDGLVVDILDSTLFVSSEVRIGAFVRHCLCTSHR